MRVINVGVYPPPYGGISIHLKRLKDYLDLKQQQSLLIDVFAYSEKKHGVINLSWRKAIMVLLFLTPKCIIHFHLFTLKNTFIYFLMTFRHKVILSLHNERFLDEIGAISSIWRVFVAFFLRHLDVIVVDTKHSQELIEKIVKNKTRVVIIPEFIPPSFVPDLDDRIIEEARQKHKYLLSSNASNLTFHRGQDLYGLDMLVELMDRMTTEYKLDVAMIFLLPNNREIEYFELVNQRIHSLGLAERFIFIREPIPESASLWKISDVVIRATNTDGNSLTVLEALYVQTPVIASDCCERPAGTILFKSRDVNDMCVKVVMVLSSLDHYRDQLKYIQQSDNAAALLNLYYEMGTNGRKCL